MVTVVILMSLSTPFEIIYLTWFGIMVEGTRKASLGGAYWAWEVGQDWVLLINFLVTV